MEANNLIQKKKVQLLDSKIITLKSVQDDNSPDSMNGFAVIKEENMETAIKIAKTDHFLESGCTVRVSQMMEMKQKLVNLIMIIQIFLHIWDNLISLRMETQKEKVLTNRKIKRG